MGLVLEDGLGFSRKIGGEVSWLSVRGLGLSLVFLYVRCGVLG